MKRQLKHKADPLSIEVFVIDETFESVFNALKGVYFRLYFKESKNIAVDLKKKNFYLKKFGQINDLKNSINPNDYPEKKVAVNKYSKELKKMVNRELNDYAATIG